MGEVKCHCGSECWFPMVYEDEPEMLAKYPCKVGEYGLNCSEDYPGTYMHFCDAHGHPEDGEWRRDDA